MRMPQRPGRDAAQMENEDMAHAVRAASLAILATLLIASPALAQTTVVVPAPQTTVVTPAPPAVTTVPERRMTYPVAPDTRLVEPRLSPVARDPSHPPITAVAGGPSPANPAEYATNSPITVTGRIDGVSRRNDVTSFRLQTPTEAWTVVVPPGDAGPVASGRAVTVVGYPHIEIRNQVLAQSVTAGR
jgi:hypothetical protein